MGSRAESHELNTLLDEEYHNPDSTPKAEALRVSGDSRVPIIAQRPAPAKLFRRTYLLFLVSLYSCLSIIAWTIICVQTHRPITTHTYSYQYNQSYQSIVDDVHDVLAKRMKSNAEWFRAAKICLAISNTLIIPLTSTVCASAAVIYVQNFGRRRHFSMQHTATLADKGWSSPQVWLALLSIQGWRSQGSYFLAFAMGFHALGALIGPLQQYYIGQETFKFQTVSTYGFQTATDIPELFRDGGPDGIFEFQTARLRNELASVSLNDFQPNIWQEVPPQCLSNSSNNFQVSPECNQGGATFSNLTTLQGPYIAQLPAGYNTGLITQFMPRMNSSAFLSQVPRTAFPLGCNANPEAYYIEYSYNTTLLNVQVCMLDGTYQSPWKSNRDRQDATETMFLDIHFSSSENPATMNNNPANATFKITINTTLGYFELPNYNNSGSPGSLASPGPLLAKDPYDTCPVNKGLCESQGLARRSLQMNETSASLAIENAPNLGPLAMIVAAMFEPGSFIATQIPQKDITPSFMLTAPGHAMPCTIPPLNLLFDRVVQQPQCDDLPLTADEGYDSIIQWLGSFYDISSMQNALHAAALLASQAWLSSVEGNLDVQYDMGQDSIRPKISSAGIVLLSILLSIDLLLLLAVATYISFSYTWAEALDSSAIMRLGAARADELPLQVSSSEMKEKTRAILERMPGWVGDARPDDEVGTMAIGATVPLRAGRRYQVS